MADRYAMVLLGNLIGTTFKEGGGHAAAADMLESALRDARTEGAAMKDEPKESKESNEQEEKDQKEREEKEQGQRELVEEESARHARGGMFGPGWKADIGE